MKDHKKYIGLTNNIERRIAEHNSGKVESTKYRVPLELIYFEEFKNRTEAAERKKFFKTGKGREFLKNNISYWRRGQVA